MNFYRAKFSAKKNSFFLIFIFLLSVGLYILFINTIALSIYATFNGENFKEAYDLYESEYVFTISTYVFGFVLFGMIYKFIKLKRGGEVVAMSLGGVLVGTNSRDFHEKQVLNIVEEISLASGIAPLNVYVLKDLSINAFVAGYSYDDAVLCVTKGLMLKLNKEEIQGVVAHEFSHVFNLDMRINLYLTSILHGILIVGILGWQLINVPLSLGEKKPFFEIEGIKNNDIGGGIAGVLLVLGIFLMILGAVGTLIGDSIKALICRQREYLADAMAVEFTRYPIGIANALKKIGGDDKRSFIGGANTKTYSHFYFASGGSFLISTHPPLKKRILKLDPNWDGEFIIPYITAKASAPKRTQGERLDKVLQSVVLLERLEKLKDFDFKNLQVAKHEISEIPNRLKGMVRDGFSAQGVVLALMAYDGVEVPNAFKQNLKLKNKPLYYQFELALKEVRKLKRYHYLSLILISITSLKQISKNQYMEFRDTVLSWIWANQKIVFFEWNLKQLLFFPLDLHFGFSKPVHSIYSLKDVKKDASYFLSFLLSLNTLKEDRENVFNRVCLEEKITKLSYINVEKMDFKRLEKAFNTLAYLDDEYTAKLLKVSVRIFNKNGYISPENLEMFYAIAAALRLPIAKFGIL